MPAPGEANEKLDASLQGGLFHKEEKGPSVKQNQRKSHGFDFFFKASWKSKRSEFLKIFRLSKSKLVTVVTLSSSACFPLMSSSL